MQEHALPSKTQICHNSRNRLQYPARAREKGRLQEIVAEVLKRD